MSRVAVHNAGMRYLRSAVRPIIIVALAIALGMICVPLFMRYSMRAFIYSSAQDSPTAEVAIVLGASVLNGKPSPILAERADTAIELYETGKVAKILVTGDNGELTYDEVTPVRRYLTQAGVAADDIFLDHAGFDTYSSMYRAQAVFQAQSAIIVTQDFHLPRALFIARHLGMNAYGVVASGEGSPLDYLREIPASDKAFWDIVSARVPRFLGISFPLSRSGTSTWY